VLAGNCAPFSPGECCGWSRRQHSDLHRRAAYYGFEQSGGAVLGLSPVGLGMPPLRHNYSHAQARHWRSLDLLVSGLSERAGIAFFAKVRPEPQKPAQLSAEEIRS
jgi:hypothetical protein